MQGLKLTRESLSSILIKVSYLIMDIQQNYQEHSYPSPNHIKHAQKFTTSISYYSWHIGEAQPIMHMIQMQQK